MSSDMDSRLDSIMRTTFQPAEKTDTHLGIKREEPQEQQKRKDGDKKEEEKQSLEDIATLSIPALHNFLKTLLQQSGQKGNPPQAPITPQAAAPAAGYRAGINAYQSASQSTAKPGMVSISDTPPPEKKSASSIGLQIEEIRAIHKLIADVEILSARGVGFIPLRMADTFLETLANGIKEAMDQSS